MTIKIITESTLGNAEHLAEFVIEKLTEKKFKRLVKRGSYLEKLPLTGIMVDDLIHLSCWRFSRKHITSV